MIILNTFKEVPDGTDILLNLLNKFKGLKREQIIIYFLQIDESCTRQRVNYMLNKLVDMKILTEHYDIISLADAEYSQNTIDAFWAALHLIDSKTEFGRAEFPSEIVLKNGHLIEEVIVMDKDSLEKLDYLSKRKIRKNQCKYNLLFTSGTIDDYDDELITDIPITLITMNFKSDGVPKLSYHEVSSCE